MKETNHRKYLSIIIITKNEAGNVRRCLDSVLQAVKNHNHCEILLVDSASTDKTIDIAKQYPILIFQLRHTWKQTPAAGRYIGFKHAKGKYIMFLDGDMTLHDNWLDHAFPFFDMDNKIACVVGRREDLYLNAGKIIGRKEDYTAIGNKVQVNNVVIGGAAIYRASVLRQVGSFNPYLYAHEEAELCYRIYKAGYKIVAIPHDMIKHYTCGMETIEDLFKRFRNKYLLGSGQVLRYGIHHNRLNWKLFQKAFSNWPFMSNIMIGFLCFVISSTMCNWIIFFAWSTLMLLLFTTFIIKSRSIKKPLYYILVWILQSYCVIRGFIMEPKDPNTYPTDVLIIKSE